jgi:hypothetical protein
VFARHASSLPTGRTGVEFLAVLPPGRLQRWGRVSTVGATSAVSSGEQSCVRAWRKRRCRFLNFLPKSLLGTESTILGSRTQPSGIAGRTPTLLAKK